MNAQATIQVGRPGGGMDPLVAAAASGDRSAFSELAARHRRQIHAHAYRLLRSYEDAEDVTQETFLRAWRMRGTFQGRSPFGAWLSRIATNACLTALERRARRREAPRGQELDSIASHDGIAASEPAPEADLVAKESIDAVLVALRPLPPRQRAVLFLRDVLGWSAKETAALLGTSVVSANSALQRARATVRERLRERRVERAAASVASEDRAPPGLRREGERVGRRR